jgi:predicted  nucleic acid-binding Zn-ribbon protein
MALSLNKEQIEREIDDEQKYYSEICIKKEKAELRKSRLGIRSDEGDALAIQKDIEEYDSILKQNQDNIEALEDKIEFFNKKIIDLERTIDEVNKEEIKGLDLNTVNSVQSAQTLLIAFFNIILEVKVQRVELEETVIEQHTAIQEIEKECKILRESKRTAELEFNRALQRREKEFKELEAKMREEAENQDAVEELQTNDSKSLSNLEAKRQQRINK